ncbi:F510_1955 family glycosylhydrolase [Microbacterium sp. M]|uniref:F510_1955 family glycosylhydrolase n=1 Tax=Microbacterium sp. M TaxID=3377125 RepID=UPI00386DCD8C
MTGRLVRRGALSAVFAGSVLVLGGCTTAVTSETEAPRLEHVHAIAPSPGDDTLLIASHNGIFELTPAGDLEGPLGGHVFDAMGFAVVGDALYASGHPGDAGSADWGAPNLGLIHSDDTGETWQAVALSDRTDFHALAAAPDGWVFGIPSDGTGLLVGADEGSQWARGGLPDAVDLVATDAALFAATEDGLLSSVDGGSTFEAVPDAPVLYAIDAHPEGALAGVGTDGTIWVERTAGAWERVERTEGAAQAFAVDGDRYLVVDDRGVVEVTERGTKVLLSPVVATAG